MLGLFRIVAPYLKFHTEHRVIIDNLVFRLHYRWTFVILLVATILVCSQQYIGEHINCITGSLPSRVVNTFCFFTSTFTVVRHLNNSALHAGAIFQPGIGPYVSDEEPIKRHAYYQWVPFVLFSQALCFYVPHFLWKIWEGKRIASLVFGMKLSRLSHYLNANSKQYGDLHVTSLEETDNRLQSIRWMMRRLQLNHSWSIYLLISECLNLGNLLLQIYLTNRFLGGEFYGLGPKVYRERWLDQMDVLDVIFPKITKCHFHKYGPSGSLQVHDTLCVMALNVINEKIFTILWFWFGFLGIVTIMGLLWRLLTFFLYKSVRFSYLTYQFAKPGYLRRSDLSILLKDCNYSNWLFLYFLRSNLSECVFRRFLTHLASEGEKGAELEINNSDPCNTHKPNPELKSLL